MKVHPILSLLGIDHISPSHIQAWNQSPAAWACRYLFGIKTTTTVNMQIGKLVEDLILKSQMHGIHFDDVTTPHRDGLSDKELEKATYMAFHGCAKLSTYLAENNDSIIGTQMKIEASNYSHGDPLPAPLIGFADAVTKKGAIIEIKTAGRAPAGDEPTRPHLQQLSTYVMNSFYDVGLQGGYVKLFTPRPRGLILYCLTRKEKPTIMRELHIFEPDKDSAELGSMMHDAFQCYMDFEADIGRYHNFLDLFENAARKISGDSNVHYLEHTPQQQRRIVKDICAVLPVDFGHFRMSDYSPNDVFQMFRTGEVSEDLKTDEATI